MARLVDDGNSTSFDTAEEMRMGRLAGPSTINGGDVGRSSFDRAEELRLARFRSINDVDDSFDQAEEFRIELERVEREISNGLK